MSLADFSHLEPALDQIKRGDGGVGDAAGEHAAEAAQRVVLGRAELARVLLLGGGGRQRAASHGRGGRGGGLLRLALREGAGEQVAQVVHGEEGGAGADPGTRAGEEKRGGRKEELGETEE